MTVPVGCRLCATEVTRTLVDLGTMPSANSYLRPGQRDEDEVTYPLRALVCDRCLFVQLEAVISPDELFRDYAYFSSFSDSWVEHGRRFTDRTAAALGLGHESLVVEVASNDGYLLQHFVAIGVPVLGIEPAANVAEVARARGVPTETVMFGRDAAAGLRKRVGPADLLVANNVLAHVPDLHDFVAGLGLVLASDGVLSVEVPHLLRLIEDTQFDTIYHEHFSYFSLRTVEQALAAHGLAVFDVEQLPTHGGSLRVWAAPTATGRSGSARLGAVRELEDSSGLYRIETYAGFAARVEQYREGVLEFLAGARADGKVVVAYGAAAKGNTLLNYCGVTIDDIAYVADRSTEKQGRRLPGSHLLVVPPERILETRPDYVVVLPWNLWEEISTQLAVIGEWGGQFVTFGPTIRVGA